MVRPSRGHTGSNGHNGTMADRITRDAIVDAALTVLADAGLHGLAMRRIASELGVRQGALYWHFENKQQLLSAVADRIVEPVGAATTGDWRARVTALAHRLRGELLRYPDGAELVASAIAFRLGAQHLFVRVADELTGAGHARDDADVAAAVLVHFVLGHTADEQEHRQAAALGAIPPDAVVADDAEARFRRGVALIVAGIAAGGADG